MPLPAPAAATGKLLIRDYNRTLRSPGFSLLPEITAG
jgi:hypothetical protein